jgi:hypothetical protein
VRPPEEDRRCEPACAPDRTASRRPGRSRLASLTPTSHCRSRRIGRGSTASLATSSSGFALLCRAPPVHGPSTSVLFYRLPVLLVSTLRRTPSIPAFGLLALQLQFRGFTLSTSGVYLQGSRLPFESPLMVRPLLTEPGRGDSPVPPGLYSVISFPVCLPAGRPSGGSDLFPSSSRII